LGYNINIGNILSNTSIGGKYIELAAASSGISLSTSGTLDLIATAYNMGTTLLSATNINIGTTGKSTTTIYGGITTAGLITASGGLTMSGDKCITLGTPTTNPTSSQLGYFSTVAGATITGLGTTPQAGWTLPSNLPIGVYMVTFTSQLGGWSGGAANVLQHSISSTGATVGVQVFNTCGTATSNGDIFSGFIRYTSATNTFQINVNASNGTVNVTSPTYTIVRVA
jgi:hypothetical protein